MWRFITLLCSSIGGRRWSEMKRSAISLQRFWCIPTYVTCWKHHVRRSKNLKNYFLNSTIQFEIRLHLSLYIYFIHILWFSYNSIFKSFNHTNSFLYCDSNIKLIDSTYSILLLFSGVKALCFRTSFNFSPVSSIMVSVSLS